MNVVVCCSLGEVLRVVHGLQVAMCWMILRCILWSLRVKVLQQLADLILVHDEVDSTKFKELEDLTQ